MRFSQTKKRRRNDDRTTVIAGRINTEEVRMTNIRNDEFHDQSAVSA